MITYTITVENTGDETLNGVTVMDSLLGNLSGSYDDVFSPGEEESHDFTYTVTAQSPDPVPNTVTASGTGCHVQRHRDRHGVVLHGHPQPRHRCHEDLHRNGAGG